MKQSFQAQVPPSRSTRRDSMKDNNGCVGGLLEDDIPVENPTEPRGISRTLSSAQVASLEPSAPVQEISIVLDKLDDIRHELARRKSDGMAAAEMLGATLTELGEIRQETAEAKAREQAHVETLGRIQEELGEMRQEMTRLKTDEQVFAEMHERNRELSEAFHERNVMEPVFLSLIGMADRAAGLVEEAEHANKAKAYSGSPLALGAIRSLCDAREADIVELQELLASFGVEHFVSANDMFDARIQRCISRVECRDPLQDGQIAESLRPGYRRNGKVIRPECVSVYVFSDANVTKGGLS